MIGSFGPMGPDVSVGGGWLGRSSRSEITAIRSTMLDARLGDQMT